MSLTKIRDAAVRVIRDLPNRPTGTGHMTAAALKAAFDQAAENIKTAVNQMISQLESPGGAAEIGFQRSTGVPANNVQDAIENVQQQIAGVALGSIPDGSITAAKLRNGSITGNKLHSNAAGFEDISSSLSIQSLFSDSYPCDISGISFMFSKALGMMFIVGPVGFTKTGSGIYSQRFEITGPYRFGYLGSIFSSASQQGEPRVYCDPLGDHLQIDVIVDNATENPYNNYVGVDISGWLFCEEVSS